MMLVVVVLMTTLVLSVSRHGYLKSCKKPAIAIENTRGAIHNANPQDRKFSVVEKAKMLENFFSRRTKTTSEFEQKSLVFAHQNCPYIQTSHTAK
jgi:hypothetical protein